MNAKDEFLEHIKDRKVRCASLILGDEYSHYDVKQIVYMNLRVAHSVHDFNQFLNSLNVHYDSGYGGQELFGTIWYVDGTWSERGEYDGSEWWEYRAVPAIPANLL